MGETTCGICLDELKNPVCTPCGHLHCESCLTEHIGVSSDAIFSLCPSCRAEFPIATPDLRFVPEKYHKFITPGMTIKKLEDHVKSLVQDKMLLMDRCEATMAASAKHAEGERNARLESEKLRKEMQDSRKKYDHLKEKYRDLKNSKGSPRTVCGPMQAVKRKSSQAALDSFALDPPSSSCLSQHLNATESREAFSLTDTGRPVLRIPKRPRLLGSPFDPSKAVSFGTVARPPVFKKYRPSPMDYLEGDHSSTVGSSGGPQRSGLPRGDIFSPEPGDSIGHHEEIDYWDGSFGRDE